MFLMKMFAKLFSNFLGSMEINSEIEVTFLLSKPQGIIFKYWFKLFETFIEQPW